MFDTLGNRWWNPKNVLLLHDYKVQEKKITNYKIQETQKLQKPRKSKRNTQKIKEKNKKLKTMGEVDEKKYLKGIQSERKQYFAEEKWQFIEHLNPNERKNLGSKAPNPPQLAQPLL